MADILAFTPQVDVSAPPPTPPAPPDCEEMGRVTRCYVSAYQRARVHMSHLIRGEKRCLVAEFNGAIPASRTIVSVTWYCYWSTYLVMSNARIQSSGRSVAVDIDANWPARTTVKCVVKLDNGERYTQLFRIDIADALTSPDEPYQTTGPTSLTASA